MPKTIIVPLDGTEFAKRALAPADALARQADAALVLVMSRSGGVVEPEAYLRRTADEAGMASARVAAFEDRAAHTAITMIAESEPDPVVCMTTHARGGLGHMFLGSVAEQVLRSIETPVVLVGPAVTDGAASDFKELIVCLDGSRIANAILPVAATVARSLELAVWLVEVFEPQVAVDDDTASEEDVLESTSLQKSAHDLADLGLNVNWDTLHGEDPAAALIAFAEARPSPLLAMTTHGRTGLARAVAGSVVMAVAHRAPCPVLVTRSIHHAPG